MSSVSLGPPRPSPRLEPRCLRSRGAGRSRCPFPAPPAGGDRAGARPGGPAGGTRSGVVLVQRLPGALRDDPRVVAAGQEALARYGAGAGARDSSPATTRSWRPSKRACRNTRERREPLSSVAGTWPISASSRRWPGRRISSSWMRSAIPACFRGCAGGGRHDAAVSPQRRRASARPPRARRGRHERALILTERGVQHGGDRAPLAAILDVAGEFDAWTLVDDATRLGVVKADDRAPLEMGTLSKTLGSYGGYLCACRPVIDLMTSRARSCVYTTGLPPASAARRCGRWRSSRRSPSGQPGPDPRAPLLRPPRLGPGRKPDRARARRGGGDGARALRRPGGARLPRGGDPSAHGPGWHARLRVAFSALHTGDQVDALAAALADLGIGGAPDRLVQT